MLLFPPSHFKVPFLLLLNLLCDVQFYFLSNLRKKIINIVINKHNILIDCLHKLTLTLLRVCLCRNVLTGARTARHLQFALNHHSLVGYGTLLRLNLTPGGATSIRRLARKVSLFRKSSVRTFRPSQWRRLEGCRRCPSGTRRSWTCPSATGSLAWLVDSNCAFSNLK